MPQTTIVLEVPYTGGDPDISQLVNGVDLRPSLDAHNVSSAQFLRERPDPGQSPNPYWPFPVLPVLFTAAAIVFTCRCRSRRPRGPRHDVDQMDDLVREEERAEEAEEVRGDEQEEEERAEEVGAEAAEAQVNYLDISLGHIIGDGGYAIVYFGVFYHRGIARKEENKKVAVKILKGNDQRTMLNEHKFLATTDHPNLVKYVGFTVDPLTRSEVVLTEYQEKGSLYRNLHPHKEPEMLDRLLDIAKGMCRGVIYLHSRNYVHRDLKSLNVLLGQDWSPLLCDFGLTETMVNTHISHKGSLDDEPGTLRWMSPEHEGVTLDGKRRGKLTEKLDSWALGTIIGEMVVQDADGLSQLPYQPCASTANIRQKWAQHERPFQYLGQQDGMRKLEVFLLHMSLVNFDVDQRWSPERALEELNDLEATDFVGAPEPDSPQDLVLPATPEPDPRQEPLPPAPPSTSSSRSSSPVSSCAPSSASSSRPISRIGIESAVAVQRPEAR